MNTENKLPEEKKIIFNPEKKVTLTYQESLGPAMEITDPQEAQQYFNDMVQWMVEQGQTIARATDICKQNLGYYAGYYSDGTRARVEKLFNCAHPVFGTIADNGAPTAEEALQAGINSAKQNL